MVEEELITQVDENDKVIGLKPRRDFDDGKLIHRSSYLILLNQKNEMLLQKRSHSKKWHAGCLTFAVAGTVGDETYEQCMQREITEALGVSLSIKEAFKYRHFDEVDRAFKAVFISQAEQDLKLNPDYAEEYLWMPVTQLRENFTENPGRYAPPFVTGMSIYFKKLGE